MILTLSNLIAELSLRTWQVTWHLHVISAQCVARDLHTIVPGPLERTCWRQFAALWGDCNKSRIAPLNAIIIIIVLVVVLLLLLLRSPAIFLGFNILRWDFCVCVLWPFFNPTIEIVTFLLRGWCMLGVLPAYTCLGHECQDLSHPKEFWGSGVRTHVNSKGKIPSTEKILLRGGSNPWRCIKQDSEPNTLLTSYSCMM